MTVRRLHDAGFSGWLYLLTDSDGDTDTAPATISVTSPPADNPATAVDDVFATLNNAPLNGTVAANDTAAEILGACLHGAMRHVVAAHLSEQNNSPELVRDAMARATGASGDEFVVADAAVGFGWLSLR